MLILARRGIGRRIAKLLAIVTFFAVLVAAFAHTTLQTKREVDNRMQALQSTGYALAAASANAVAVGDRQKALSALSAVSRIPNILMADIKLVDGTSLATMGQAVYLNDDILTADDHTITMLSKGFLPVTVDIVKGGGVVGRLIVVEDISNLRSQIERSVFITLAIAIAAALAGVLVSRPLQRRIVEPLTELTTTIQTIRKSRSYAVDVRDDGTRDEAGVLVKAFNELMGDIRSRDDALQKLAYHDPLTGLANRVSFQRTLDEWMQQPEGKRGGAVILTNIHGFRSINDAFSHSIGDAMLMTVAATLKATLTGAMSLARYSGDEFVVLLPSQTTEHDVTTALAPVHSAFEKPVQIGDLELHVTLTAGAVMLADRLDEDTAADLILRHADMALAEAKTQAAGSLAFFKPALAEIVEEETVLGQALRQATKTRDFQLHYQPQFDLCSNRVAGFEALVRWTHPVRGPISPAVFVPLAERIGLVSLIGDWVLTEGCRQAAEWLRQGQAERIMSINVSPAQILAAGFVEKVRAALSQSGLPPRLLCLELTESIFVGSRYAETVLVLETIARDGVILALDDFGTGYSSLGYLSKLPFHSIKLDRTFVSGVDRNQRKSGMLKSIVDMVHALGMTVVAEGAETMEEVAHLRRFKIEKVQGFVYAKPLPGAAAVALANNIDRSQNVLSA